MAERWTPEQYDPERFGDGARLASWVFSEGMLGEGGKLLWRSVKASKPLSQE